MIRPKIGIDWDDVTAPFNSIAIQMANEKYGANLKLQDITSWENTGKASIIKEFYGNEELYKRQSRAIPEKNKEAIRRLMELADVYFISAASPEFMGVRAAQIVETFPKLGQERIILGAAKHLVQFDIVLDDNICNVLNSSAEYAVLMRKPWNNQMTGILSVNNLEEFVSMVEHILTVEQNRGKTEIKTPAVVALVGPSGSGKNELTDILSEGGNFKRPVSYTTKPGKKQSISEDDFNAIGKDFFETTMYGGYCYGTKKEDVQQILDSGYNAILPLDMCGAIAMKRHFPTLIVYVRKCKTDIIKDILLSDASTDEKTLRILSIDAEKKNKNICDIEVNGEDLKTAAQTISRMLL